MSNSFSWTKIAFGIVVGDDGMGNFLEKWTLKWRIWESVRMKRYRENEENSQSTEVSTHEKARFERLVIHCKKKYEKTNVRKRAIRDLKRQAREECKDESSKRRRITTDADATQNIPPIRREDARLNHPLIRLLDMKTSRKRYDSIMNDEMLYTLQQYFVEHRVIKPSIKFLNSCQGCMNVTPKLIRKCVDNIPGLKELCYRISANTPLSKGSSETALWTGDSNMVLLFIM